MATKTGSYQDYVKGETAGKQFVFILSRSVPSAAQSTITLANGSHQMFPNSWAIEAAGTTTMEWGAQKRRSPRKIRYVPGYPSIYVDEQKDVPVNFRPYMLQFVYGKLVVDGDDYPLLKLVMELDLRADKEGRDTRKPTFYRLADKKVVVQKAADHQKTLAEAQNFAWNGDWNVVVALATIKGIDTESKDSQEVRFDLSKHIDPKNPQKFLDELTNKDNIKKYVVLQAIKRGYLIHNKDTRGIYWATDPKQPIVTAPMHLDTIDYFVGVLKTQDGEEVYAYLQSMVMPTEKKVRIELPKKEELEEVAKPEPKPLMELVDNEEALRTLINEYIGNKKKQDEKSVFHYKAPAWFVFDGKRYFLKNLLEKLTTDKAFNEYFKDALLKNPKAATA